MSFEQHVRSALDGLPEHIAAALRNVAVVVEEENPDDPDLYGLFDGVPLPERGDEAGLLPNRIAVYRRPLEEDFPDPDAFIPDRYNKPEQADLANRWTWIPFGAGRHRCVGAAFAQMQIKAIFSVLLREYEFEMAQPADTYRNDHSKMVVQLARPAKARYRRRK